ncbi:hypothetical protein ACX80E_01690 [Arthrobacter sp. TMN-49]
MDIDVSSHCVCSLRAVLAPGSSPTSCGREFTVPPLPGNIILLDRNGSWPQGWSQALVAASPHLATVLSGVELDDLAG